MDMDMDVDTHPANQPRTECRNQPNLARPNPDCAGEIRFSLLPPSLFANLYQALTILARRHQTFSTFGWQRERTLAQDIRAYNGRDELG